jgi:hypothetical protein
MPTNINVLILEDLIDLVERPIVYAKAEAFDLLMHHLRSEVWHARNPMQAPAPEPASINLDGVEAVSQPTEATPAPDADPFASPQPQPDTQGQPQPRRGGRRSRRSEEGQPAGTDAQPSAEPQPAPEEGQPLTAEALGLTPEPAPQALPLPVVEAPDVSAAPTSADDVYGTEPAEDPFA